ncbi:MAG: acyl carrier protein [Spirochaetales bacterium]|nr:acyl carrier protein [Spirochaetales bacterium]
MMSKENIFKEVATILNETFEIPKENIKSETRLFEDMDLDSIDAVDLIVKLQNYTDRKIAPEVFKNVRNVGDIVDAVHQLIKENNGPV